MIKILKDGKKPKITKVIYKTTCSNCECVFEFEVKDIKYQEKHFNGKMTVECPCCHIDITQPSLNYESRIVECEE